MKVNHLYLVFIFAVALGCNRREAMNVDTLIPFANSDIRFFVIGDWGREGNYLQRELGQTMGEYADKLRPHWIISTGDHFYPSGVASVTDPHWKKSFTDIYTHKALQVSWYGVLGNHDIEGNVQAQADYHNVNPIWNLPSPYYHRSVKANDDSILFVFIDTNPFELGYYKSQKHGDYVRSQDTTAQKEWLDSILEVSPHRWKIVVGHHPMHTVGRRADNYNSVRASLEYILESREVDVYLAGHEHDMQYLRPSKVHHFVSGAGSALRELKYPERAIFAESVNAFMVMDFAGENLRCAFVNVDGEIIYRVELKKGN